jgi:hypothetical protein
MQISADHGRTTPSRLKQEPDGKGTISLVAPHPDDCLSRAIFIR